MMRLVLLHDMSPHGVCRYRSAAPRAALRMGSNAESWPPELCCCVTNAASKLPALRQIPARVRRLATFEWARGAVWPAMMMVDDDEGNDGDDDVDIRCRP